MAISTVDAYWIRAALQAKPYGYGSNNQSSEAFSSRDAFGKALLNEIRRRTTVNVPTKAATMHFLAIGIIDYMCPYRTNGGCDE